MPPSSTESPPFSALSAIASGSDVHALVLVAHPDDETIAVGGRLWSWPSASVVHLTQGAPSDPTFARNAGFADTQSYAAARARELSCALQTAGVSPSNCYQLGYTDQETCLSLLDIVREVADLIERLGPNVIVTHAYEGGHPDHDSAAFAACAACGWLTLRARPAPVIVEAPFYHHARSALAICEFLPVVGVMELELELDASQRAAKQDMFACFESQRDILGPFPTDRERFRMAPTYDFERPPHPGSLHYETLGWPLTGAAWRGQAQSTLSCLGLRQPAHGGSQIASRPI
jgi:LmbE family N-acetylglucosaminyl deacetylase